MSKINTNCVILTGNLTKDAVLRYTANQKPVLTFSLAVNRLGPDDKSVADFFPVVLWGRTAEALQKWLTKGRPVAVKGRLQTRTYDDNEGRKVYVTEVVADNFGGVELLGGGDRHGGGGQQAQAPRASTRNDWNPLDVDEEPTGQAPATTTNSQEDIPF